jgi:hypothetical protein
MARWRWFTIEVQLAPSMRRVKKIRLLRCRGLAREAAAMEPTKLASACGPIASHLHFDVRTSFITFACAESLDVLESRVDMALVSRLRPALDIGVRFLPLRHASPSRRSLHLAPPYLLDDYIPQYHLISSVDAAKKRSLAYAHLRECNLCPRLCGVNRYEKTGVCMIGAETVKVNTIAPHFGEGRTY